MLVFAPLDCDALFSAARKPVNVAPTSRRL
jgi:hypothetical protein